MNYLTKKVDGHCISVPLIYLTKWGEETGVNFRRQWKSWSNTPSKSISDSLDSVFSSLFAWSITQVKHTTTWKTETEYTNKNSNKRLTFVWNLYMTYKKTRWRFFLTHFTRENLQRQISDGPIKCCAKYVPHYNGMLLYIISVTSKFSWNMNEKEYSLHRITNSKLSLN